MTLNLVVVLTKNYAIRYADKLPWEDKQYFDWFNNLTKDGVLVMGRKTFEELPVEMRPLNDRINIVLSNEFPKYSASITDNLIYTNIYFLENQLLPNYSDKNIWIIGGRQIYEALHNRCTHFHVVLLDKTVKDAQMKFVDILPNLELVEWSSNVYSKYEECNFRLLKYTRNFNSLSMKHEYQYLNMLKELLDYGQSRDDRTGVGTLSMFAGQQCYDVSKYLPLLTTKFVPIKIIIKELLWFLRGETDAKILQEQGVHIWDGNSTRDFLDKRGLTNYEEGELGPIYSHQWRYFGAEYCGCHVDYSGKGGFDQIQYILDELKNNPFSRRILLSAWNPKDMNKMALPPCHVLFQLYVEEDPVTKKRYLSGHLYQRSSDYFLAANYNLVSYTVLLYILAKKTGYYPKNMFMSFGDRHIYKNHIEQAKLQLSRNPRPQPILLLDDSIVEKDWKDIAIDDFDLVGYLYHPAIKAEMAV